MLHDIATGGGGGSGSSVPVLSDDVGSIVYDEDSVTPELQALLLRLPPDSPIVFATSERDADGRAFPVATWICSDT